MEIPGGEARGHAYSNVVRGMRGNLMKGSGLEEILNVAYKGVSSMLNGKVWEGLAQSYERPSHGCDWAS